jgi:hypothetical protein
MSKGRELYAELITNNFREKIHRSKGEKIKRGKGINLNNSNESK